ncbi:MAG: phosphatidate cytidylyltransferase [Peptococcaceae bacterium]|jgi:phosphatidate cytidylyltransferase|nr:phosphatidate cytidylyltransferase [Peptococcaceae bacterium]MDH7524072.1 phosphatidate cytidylyltransferase [Peptococcaceae bacterium]
MLVKRVLVALIGIPVVVYAFYVGGLLLLTGIIILVIAGLVEFKNLAARSGHQVLGPPMWAGGLIIPLVYQYWSDMLAAAFLFLAVFAALFYLVGFPRFSPFELSFTVAGVIYIVMGFSHLLLIRDLENGFWLVVYLFVIVWSTDTGAYFTGTVFGRHLLAPHISPNKKWEGFFGGLLVSILAAYILIRVSPPEKGCLFLGVAPFVSIAGQAGDLFESALKRYAGVKDSGTIIPGHGGVLDRFDSVLWAAPVTYYLFLLMERLF